MLEAKLLWFAVAGVLVIGAIVYRASRRRDVGTARFFANQSYHFQTLLALNDMASYRADTAEVLYYPAAGGGPRRPLISASNVMC